MYGAISKYLVLPVSGWCFPLVRPNQKPEGNGEAICTGQPLGLRARRERWGIDDCGEGSRGENNQHDICDLIENINPF